jgi:hypothetical protein
MITAHRKGRDSYQQNYERKVRRGNGVKDDSFPSWDDANAFYANESAARGHLLVLAHSRHVGLTCVARAERKRDENHHSHRA